MRKGILAAAAALLLAFAALAQAAAEGDVKIGFLVWNGPFKGMQQWQATGEHLAEKLGRPVTVLPLEFKDVLPAVEAGRIDFFTADPSMFATAKAQHGAEAVLTMKNPVIGTELIGAAIFTSAKNNAVNGLTDLRGKKFGALRRWSFAGWQMAELEFQDAGLDAYGFISTLRFFETPQAVIKAVLSGQTEAGIVPTGLLEMAAESGELSLEDVKILEKKHHKDFPYVCSTVLYPGFVLAKTAGVDPQLAGQVAAILKKLKADDKALATAGVTAWIDPLDYTVIEKMQSRLRGYAGETEPQNSRQEYARNN
ncbi:phosphate/phosphite/phosphonate ABC transporter substrate-binding protein [Candidatus Electronema sp. TJ]|uniref:phosphate/phosphite/phosphonate ABC transporter substrate-binding protein n=1 Tax=Candidatus Electronema sp. TJ TaxID=3401573 RepID=UPI003AA8EBD2